MPVKPKLFIGSSKEAVDAGLLDSLKTALESGLNSPTATIELVPWTSSPWANLTQAVQSLMDNLVDYSYAVFSLSADDELTLRTGKYHAARDNVIFEFGLFLAHLGLERTFLVGPSDVSKTIAMAAVKTTVAPTGSPSELPLRIATDLGGVYRKGSYSISSPGLSPTISFQVDEVVAAIKAVESKVSPATPADAQNELAQRLLAAKAEITKGGKTAACYSGQFFSRFRDIAALKALASSKTVQNVVQDLLLSLEWIGDLCDAGQMADEQHYSKGINQVWVFADSPLEFRAGASSDPATQKLRNVLIDNLKNGVDYVYFVGPDFKKDDVDHLVAPRDSDRAAMLKRIHVIKVHSHFFSTYFTLHFDPSAKGPKAIYMSSVMRDRKDVLILVSDTEHVKRIYDRICVLRGELEHEDSPKITRYVLR